MRTFTHLNLYSRDRIESLWDERVKQKEIAKIVGVHKSTVSREIKKRQKEDGTYSATVAQHKAGVKRGNSKYQGMKIEQHQSLKKHIVRELKQYRSPDEIAGRMKEEGIEACRCACWVERNQITQR